jgi:hypothetical protein
VLQLLPLEEEALREQAQALAAVQATAKQELRATSVLVALAEEAGDRKLPQQQRVVRAALVEPSAEEAVAEEAEPRPEQVAREEQEAMAAPSSSHGKVCLQRNGSTLQRR